LTKNVIFVFLLAQTFLKKKALPKKQGLSFLRSVFDKPFLKTYGSSLFCMGNLIY